MRYCYVYMFSQGELVVGWVDDMHFVWFSM